MVEGGILDRLIQLPRHSDLGVQHSFLKFFATLAQFGRFTCLGSANTQFLLENCREKMLDGDMFDGLKVLVQDLHPEVRQSSLKIFRDLIQFGMHLRFVTYSCSSFIRGLSSKNGRE